MCVLYYSNECGYNVQQNGYKKTGMYCRHVYTHLHIIIISP